MQEPTYALTKGSKRINVAPSDVARMYALIEKGYIINYPLSSKGLPPVPETAEAITELMRTAQANTYSDAVAPVSTVVESEFKTVNNKVSDAVTELKRMIEEGGEDLAERLAAVAEGDARVGVKGFVEGQINKLQSQE